MAQSQANLTPQEQQTLFDLMKKSGQQPTTNAGTDSTDAPDTQDQQGVGNVDYSGMQQLFGQGQPQPTSTPPLQQQPGDLMHPADAIQHIGNTIRGPQLIPMANGQAGMRVPVNQPLLKLFGIKHTVPVDTTNFLPLAKQMGVNLPQNLPTLPDGTPLVTASIFKDLAASKLGATANNPTVTKDEFKGYGGSEAQWKAAGLGDDDTMAFTKVRGLLQKESADAMTQRAANQKLSMLLQYGGPGAVQQAASDAYSRLSNINRADGPYNVIDNIQGGNADKRQRALLLTEISRVINPTGVVTNEALNNMATDTAGQKINDWKEWLLNQAQPTDFKGFLPSLRNMLDQEKAINQNLFFSASNMGLDVMKNSMPGGVSAASQAMANNPVLNPAAPSRVPPAVQQPVTPAQPQLDFSSPDGIKAAYQAGKLSIEQAKALLKGHLKGQQ